MECWGQGQWGSLYDPGQIYMPTESMTTWSCFPQTSENERKKREKDRRKMGDRAGNGRTTATAGRMRTGQRAGRKTGPGSGACPRCTLLRAGGLAADKASGVTSEDDSRKPQPCRPRSLVPTLGRSPSSGQARFGHHHSPELTQLCDPAKCVSGFRGGRRQTTGFGGSALLVAEEKGSCSWDGHTEPGFLSSRTAEGG